MRLALAAIIAGLAADASAQSLVAARTIRSKAIISAEDLTRVETAIPGAVSDPHRVIGFEARVMLYAGRPILASDIGPPALVERNQIVGLVYVRGGLKISAEARAMTRGAEGEPVRVMNLSSRSTVSGIVMADGTVRVGSGGS